MAFCPNCGTEHQTMQLRCECGYIFGSSTASTPSIAGFGTSPALVQAPAAPPPSPDGLFSFTGQGQNLLVLYVKLFLFSLFTLGIYSFWGRTEIRRYLWANIRLVGQPFGYHGTGLELLKGWLKLIGLVIVLFGGASLLPLLFPEDREIAASIVSVSVSVLAVSLLPFILHGTLTYRLSRTSWQGRRFAYRGEVMELTKIFWIGALLTLVTLGVYAPFFITDLRKYTVQKSWYSGHTLQFQGEGKDLLWPWVKFLLLLLPTFTLNRFWFESTMANYNWSRTSFAGAPLRSNYTGGGFFFLALTNGLLLVFTLGMAWPWTVCRKLSYVYDNLRFDFLPRIHLTDQVSDASGALGETMGTDIDLGAGLGL